MPRRILLGLAAAAAVLGLLAGKFGVLQTEQPGAADALAKERAAYAKVIEKPASSCPERCQTRRV